MNTSFSLITILGIAVVAIVVVAVLAVVIFKKLISASKNATEQEDDGVRSLESKIRNSLSKARQEKFKADSKVKRLTGWANDAIQTTYSDLFPEGMPYAKEELVVNYNELKTKYGEKMSYEQMDKCDQIVVGYKNQIDAEESKIKTFDKIQKEYEELKNKVLETKAKERKQAKLDKHAKRLQSTEDDISADTAAIEQGYKLEDLTKEVELKEEYINQLERLSYEYGDDIPASKSLDYKNSVDNIITKM